jgi:hypothetical protein
MILFSMIGQILAETGLPEPTAPGKGFSKLMMNDSVIIVALGFLLMAGLIFWAAVIRGPRQQSVSRRIYKSSHDSHAEGSEDSEGGGRGRRRKKKKVQRREHRARRPTLAEAGGLPQPRPQDSAGSQPPS